MPARFNDLNGFGLHIVKLNGILDISFSCKSTVTTGAADYNFQGADTVDTEQITTAHQEAFGERLCSRDMDLYLEQVQGVLDMHFEGARGEVITFRYDGSARIGKTPVSMVIPTPRQQQVQRVTSTKADSPVPKETNKPKVIALSVGKLQDITFDDRGKEDDSKCRAPHNTENALPNGSKSPTRTRPEHSLSLMLI
jgi:hypothetical protein